MQRTRLRFEKLKGALNRHRPSKVEPLELVETQGLKRLESCFVLNAFAYDFHAERVSQVDGRFQDQTGPLKVDDLASGEKHGNFFKLVYAVGRSQDEAHRGGSWGLGKTIYFRIGCGLVFYYTRIKTGAGFEERLAVCLVEDERSPDKLQENSQTGIAWWGTGLDGPVLDTAEIAKVLHALGVPRYTNEETGTVVVVPFLAEKLGPPATEPDEPGITAAPLAEIPWWHLPEFARHSNGWNVG